MPFVHKEVQVPSFSKEPSCVTLGERIGRRRGGDARGHRRPPHFNGLVSGREACGEGVPPPKSSDGPGWVR